MQFWKHLWHNPFDVLLILVGLYFAEGSWIYIQMRLLLDSSLVVSLSAFAIELITFSIVKKYTLSSLYFGEEFAKSELILLISLVEFTNKTVWSWTFLYVINIFDFQVTLMSYQSVTFIF